MKPTLLVLAAGMGSRYGGLKQTDKLGPSGETIIDYSVFDAKRAGFGKVVFIIREDIRQEFEDTIIAQYKKHIDCSYVLQAIDKLPEGFSVPEGRVKPWGTAHAMLMAADEIKEPFAVINADDFYGYEAFKLMAEFLENQNPEGSNYSMMGYHLYKTLSDFGTVSRGICKADENHLLIDVEEVTKIARIENQVSFIDENEKTHPIDEKSLVSMNFWGFMPGFFDALKAGFVEFLKEKINVPKSEYYIPTEVNVMLEEGRATVKVIPTSSDWFGVTYQEDKPVAMAQLEKLVEQGVYPKKLW